MADLAVTAASVIASTAAQNSTGIAGVTITAGQAVYLDTADNKLRLADSDGTTPANIFTGIARNGAAVNQPVNYTSSDPDFIPGATLVPGQAVYLSDAPGGITQTFADLETGDRITILGVAKSTTVMNLSPIVGGTL